MREINLNMTKALYTPAQEKRGNLSFNKQALGMFSEIILLNVNTNKATNSLIYNGVLLKRYVCAMVAQSLWE